MTDARDSTEHSGRTGILVLGMHRSGTSMLTRALSLLGAQLPRVIMPAATSNDAGHWEPQRLVDLNDRMLLDAGSRWDDWQAFTRSILGSDHEDRYKEAVKEVIADEYGEAPLLVIKDPRICRLVPFYDEVLTELAIRPCYVMPHRNPLAVIDSLNRRDGMTSGFAGLLWLRHVLDAEAATRGKPRCFVSYEAFLDDWRGPVERMVRVLALNLPRSIEAAASEIGGHVSRDLQHHAPELSDLEQDEKVAGWVKEVYGVLLKLESHENEEDLAILDRVKHEFDAASAVFGEATFPEITAREQRLAGERDQFVASVREREAEAERLAGERDQLTGALRASQAEAERLDAIVRHKEGEIGVLRNALADATVQISSLEGRLHGHEQHIAGLEGQIERIYEGRTWRYGLAVRRAVSFPIAMTFFAGRRLRLRPLKDVKNASSGHSATGWKMTGDDPRFALAWRWTCPLLPGRYRLTIEMAGRAQDAADAVLYVDSGKGFNEGEALRLRWKAAGVEQLFAEFSLDRGADKLRLDPDDRPNEFTIGRVWLRKISSVSLLLSRWRGSSRRRTEEAEARKRS